MSRNSEKSFTADSERISKDFIIDKMKVVKNFLWSEQVNRENKIFGTRTSTSRFGHTCNSRRMNDVARLI